MKRLIKICIGMVLFISFLYSQEKEWYVPQLGDLGYGVKVPIEKERELFKMDIKPVTPSEGIMTGHVILYGHYIKSPYKVEIKDDTLLFLNGVQIYPSLQPRAFKYRDSIHEKRLQEKYAWMRSYTEHTNKVLRKIQEIYRRVAKKENYNLKIAMDSVLEFLKNDPWVKQGKIEIFDIDTVTFAGFRMRYIYAGEKRLDFGILLYTYEPSPQNISLKEEKKMRKRFLEEIKKSIENRLKKGEIYSDILWEGKIEDLFLLIKILKDGTFTLSQKLLALHKILLTTPERCKIYLYNFDSTEYPTLKEMEKEINEKYGATQSLLEEKWRKINEKWNSILKEIKKGEK